MKNLLIIFLLLLGCFSCSAPQKEKPVLRHVVLFDWKEGTTNEQIAAAVENFKAIKTKIDFIQQFECGKDVSPEGLQKGYDYCFIVTFKNEADRDKYLPHPAHKELGQQIGPYIENVMVVDFWTE